MSRLTIPVQRLFASNVIEIIASALVSVFTEAFIWRASGSVVAVTLYPLVQFAIQPFFFWVNGLLLRRYSVRKLFCTGAISVGIANVAVILVVASSQIWVFVLLGIVRAFSQGLYWPNRNQLELQEVRDASRNYYFSTLQAVSWAVNTFVPIVVGWSIVFFTQASAGSIWLSYLVIFIMSFVCMAISGVIVLRQPYASPSPQRIHRFAARPIFNVRRALGFAQGMTDGLFFVSSVLVIIFLGGEGTLGSLTAATSCIAAGISYLYGRFSTKSNRVQSVFISVLLYFVSAFSLAFVPGAGMTIYILLSGVALSALAASIAPIYLALSDEEMRNESGQRYSFVFDNELVLNAGRVAGILTVVALWTCVSNVQALIYGPLVVVLIQIGIMTPFFMEKRRCNPNASKSLGETC